MDAGSTTKSNGANATPCIDAGCTNGACMEVPVWQQSSPCIPWEQFMESQHSMAWSGAMRGEQSNPYAAKAKPSTAIRIGLAKRIDTIIRYVGGDMSQSVREMCMVSESGVVKMS